MNDRIESLFQKYFSNTVSAEEKKELMDWIAGNADLQDWLTNQISAASGEMDKEQQKHILDRIHLIIGNDQKKSFKLPAWIKSAAAVILILITAGSLYWAISNQNKTETVKYATVEAMRGQKSNVTLPDGTKVLLNSESKISYGTDYNKKTRAIKLDGEAFFEVTADKEHPFIVNAGDIAVKAVGTAFNVRAYANEEYISATLSEGKVNFQTPYETRSMLPNERIEFDSKNRKTALVKLDDAKKSIGWLNDQFSFENATLDEIAKNLSRTYNISIEFSSDYISQQRYTGKINNNSLQSVLRILSLTSPIRYSIKDNKVIIYEVQKEKKFFKP